MKKSKILVPAIALLALGVAGSTVGTVAWFSVNEAQKKHAVDTATVTAVTSATDNDLFKVTPVVEASFGNVYLTDKDGDTYILMNGANVKVDAPASPAVAYASVNLTFEIEYTGAAADDAAILEAWKATCSTDITFSFTESTAYTTDNFAGRTADQVTSLSTNGGLKFFSSQPTKGTDGFAGADSLDVPVAAATAKDVTFSSKKATCNPNKTVYIAIRGVDGIEQKADDTYQFTVTPDFGELAA